MSLRCVSREDFVGTSLDDNQADNDFVAKLEALRAEEK